MKELEVSTHKYLASQSSPNDPVIQVWGSERRRHVRGLVIGSTPSRYLRKHKYQNNSGTHFYMNTYTY